MGETVIRLVLASDSETKESRNLSSESIGPRISLTKLSISNSAQTALDLNFEIDCFALLVDARTGISQAMIETWQQYAERQFPRLLLVQGLEFAETDFDDIVLIGNRTLESLATPYLVLHDDLGQPTALISLEDNLIHDYSAEELRKYSADSELVDLVADFQLEYLQLYRDLGEDGFAQGIFAIALPIGMTKKFGAAELNAILEGLSKH